MRAVFAVSLAWLMGMSLYAKASVSFLPDVSFCQGDNMMLHGHQGQLSYQWYNIAHPSIVLGTDSLLKINDVAGSSTALKLYVVTRDSSKGPFDTAYINVKIWAFSPGYSGQTAVCNGARAIFYGSGGTDYT